MPRTEMLRTTAAARSYETPIRTIISLFAGQHILAIHASPGAGL